MANEKRLIDANELVRRIQNSTASKVVRGMCSSFIISAPTVYAVEVVHGRWIKQKGIYSCSECGKACPYDVQADVIEYWPCNYCPNCGAKMDGEMKK